MRALGRMASVIMAVAVAGAVAVGVRSIPDIRRYLKIRQM